MDLQALIDSQHPNSTLELPPGEFFGQVRIDRPITIVGHGKATWIGSRTAPTIIITSSGVRLRSLMVEITTGSEHVAIEASPGTDPVLEKVIVSGLVVGVPDENIREQVIEDEPAQCTRISFLPPPPLSPSDLPMPANIQVPLPSASGQPSPSVLSSSPYSFSPGGDPTPVPESAPAARLIGAVLSIFHDPWKTLLIGISVVLGIVALLQYVDTGKGSTKQTVDLGAKLNKAEADNRALSQEIDRLKAVVAQKEKDNETVRAVNTQREHESKLLRVTLSDANKATEALRVIISEKDTDLAKWKRYASEMEKYASQWETFAGQRSHEVGSFERGKQREKRETARSNGWINMDRRSFTDPWLPLPVLEPWKP